MPRGDARGAPVKDPTRPLPRAAGNNRIPELREIHRLRRLPSLIILDLNGNPCASARTTATPAGERSASAAAAASEEYRLYVIYTVRKLKVGLFDRLADALSPGCVRLTPPPGMSQVSFSLLTVICPPLLASHSLSPLPLALHLQVLDGVPIEAAELAAAKSKHSGRLTRDFLEERLGHSMFNQIRDMDCASLKVEPTPGRGRRTHPRAGKGRTPH